MKISEVGRIIVLLLIKISHHNYRQEADISYHNKFSVAPLKFFRLNFHDISASLLESLPGSSNGKLEIASVVFARIQMRYKGKIRCLPWDGRR